MLGPTPRAGSRRRPRPLAHLMTVCVALGAALLTPTAAEAAGSTNDDAYHNLGAPDRNEWMWGVASDTRLSDMSIPGTHDTLSIHGGNYVETQQDYGDSGQTLRAQYDRGIRAIDIRVRSIGGKFTIHHASYYQKANFDDVLKKTRDFLRANPHETIVMRLRAECLYEGEKGALTDCKNEPDNVTKEQIRSTFDTYVKDYPGLFYDASVKGNGKAGIPRLGDVRGKLVLASFDNAEAGGYGIKDFNSNTEDTWNAADPNTKWDYVRKNVDKAMDSPSPHDLFLTYTSASTVPLGFSPYEYAGGRVYSNKPQMGGVNLWLMKHLNDRKAGRVGFVMMDYPGWGLVNAIIDHNADKFVSGGNRMFWVVNKDKTYVNSLYGRCMVRGPEFDDSKSGGLVTQRECQSDAPSSHQWEASQPKSFDPKGHFWIKASNGKCLTVPYNNGNPPGSGTQLFWWDCETRWFSGSQMWNVVPTKIATPTGSMDGYKFINNWTGMCLSMDPATSDKSGGKVTQETCPKK
ncbi:phosphatidylinositol-specific phospholipase C domain-containing protein [Streptomyces sp. 135]|uniref:phosphatidylinositol-specific phospholipase C domain-containing protein n=1 Tax=Streptomyces sp. 135 TaxID=2838850 RepID=UPI001CC13BE8|nr:phosphatidylinositol-specific phospholipase C domain-containing protein [Streptomyces sp. 135]